MNLKKIIKNNGRSLSTLSTISGVPYTTLYNVVYGKTDITKCNAGTVYKIAKALDVKVEDLLAPYMEKRISFELFKSNICHRLKRMGDADFLRDLLDSDEIVSYFKMEWYPECLYLLAMFDYISRLNNVPVYRGYDALRKLKLSEIIYPSGIIAMDLATGTDEAKKMSWDEAIPEFKRFNIVENDIRNVV